MEWTELTYPVDLRPDDNGTVLVTFADFPGATFGENEADALAHAREFLVDALEISMARREPIPPPTAKGTVRVAVPLSVALKTTLYSAMLAGDMTKSRLAAKMDQPKQQIDRLFKLRHRSRIDQIEEAFTALNLSLRRVLFVETSPTPARRAPAKGVHRAVKKPTTTKRRTREVA